jgi:hypothetical protein
MSKYGDKPESAAEHVVATDRFAREIVGFLGGSAQRSRRLNSIVRRRVERDRALAHMVSDSIP